MDTERLENIINEGIRYVRIDQTVAQAIMERLADHKITLVDGYAPQQDYHGERLAFITASNVAIEEALTTQGKAIAENTSCLGRHGDNIRKLDDSLTYARDRADSHATHIDILIQRMGDLEDKLEGLEGMADDDDQLTPRMEALEINLHGLEARLHGRLLGIIRSYNIHRHNSNPTGHPQEGHVIPE